MEKQIYISFLLAFYGELLTDKQQQAINMHYNMDLSLSEIAENLGGSRQGINDAIQKGITCLYAFEKKLHCLERYTRLHEELDECKAALMEDRKADVLKHLEQIGDIWED